MRITVTGAAGRLGSAVVSSLTEAGHEVVATDVVLRTDLPVRVRVANLLVREACYELVDGADCVVHLGNHPNMRVDAQRVYSENVTMNVNVAQAALEAGVKKFVFASSVQVIASRRVTRAGAVDPGSTLPYLPIDGDVPAKPGNAYALSKEAGEGLMRYLAEAHGRSAVAIRFPLLLLPEWIPRRGKPWGGYATPDECFGYLMMSDAASLVEAVVRAESTGYRVYHPAARDNVLGKPPAELVAEYFPRVPLRVPLAELNGLVDISRIERETDWSPREMVFSEGARD